MPSKPVSSLDNDNLPLEQLEKPIIDDVKEKDKRYERYRIPYNKIGPDGKFHKTMLIENYGSGSTGSLIRNAISGSVYEHVVGSKSENLYFKVVDSTGRYFRREPLVLYYDSPEQYENQLLKEAT